MAKRNRVERMIEAGRLHLNGHRTMTADDYSVKQVMAVEVPDYTAQEQTKALGQLRVEFARRMGSRAVKG